MPITRIMVIDDDSDFNTFMHDALSGEGYSVSTATTHDSGFNLISHQKPDVIILDVRMHKTRSNEALIELLQTQPISRHIPLIICTGDIAFLRNHGDELVAKGFMLLEKPFNLDNLFQLVEQALDQAPRLVDGVDGSGECNSDSHQTMVG